MHACGGGILIRIELLVGDITRESQGDIHNNYSQNHRQTFANSNILLIH